MEYNELGRTGIKVSRLCAGALTVGPLQANLSIDEGSEVLRHAIDRGVNYIDTAEYYRCYGYIREALRKSGKYDTVISTKTYAYNRELAQQAFDEARRELDRDYIDIFMLHEQESIHTLRGHAEAAEFLFEMKEKGYIRAVGVSMHHVAAVYGVIDMARLNPYSVVFPIFNKAGLGIADGKLADMESAMREAKSKGLGIIAMKALGGGNLIKSSAEMLNFVLDAKDNDGNMLCDTVALGMQSVDEVDADVSFFENRSFGEYGNLLAKKKRQLFIEEYCEGCGSCVKRCGQKALRIEDGHAVVDKDKCVLCSYCAGVCPLFAIKVL